MFGTHECQRLQRGVLISFVFFAFAFGFLTICPVSESYLAYLIAVFAGNARIFPNEHLYVLGSEHGQLLNRASCVLFQ